RAGLKACGNPGPRSRARERVARAGALVSAPILPALVPPAGMRTTHGAKMSERMGRFWDWIRRRNIGLSDFSTDQGVENVLPQLQAARADLVAELERSPNAKLQATLDDLDTIISRRPRARVRADRVGR